MSSRAVAPTGVRTQQAPVETAQLRAEIKALLETPIRDLPSLKLGQIKCGVYAFYDYDEEPIYVGQTLETLGTRIRRHLTNQRTDAVAMSVLDPFEVYRVRVWPLPQYQREPKAKVPPGCKEALDLLEASIYHHLLKGSRFGAVLNEKVPIVQTPLPPEKFPEHYERIIVTDSVREIRGHPDIRLARRSQTIARLAQIISEREPSPGLRRTLLVQAERLLWLATERFKPYEKSAISEDEKRPQEEEADPQGIE